MPYSYGAVSQIHSHRLRSSIMRNPRTVTITSAMVEKLQVASHPPPEKSLFWSLWKENLCTAEKALDTAFIKGIGSGTLNPIIFGRFNVSDAYYCYHGAEDYKIASDRASDPVLKAYLTAKHSSYKSYLDRFPTMWHLTDASGISPGDACRHYSDFERRIVKEEAPIYALIVMLPCEHLWAWLGGQLSPPGKGNLYAEWIAQNRDPKGAYAMGNFIEEYLRMHPEHLGSSLDLNKARGIYEKAMEFEYQNFRDA